MVCPSCGQENDAGAAYCLRCGTNLAQAGADRTSSAERKAQPPNPSVATPTPPVSHEPGETELTHRGQAFGAGYGSDFYGVWDLRTAGEPVARFERTPIGWEAAWRKFQELESKQVVPAWRRSSVGWILLHILIGFVGLLFLQGLVIGVVLVASGRSVDEFAPRTDAAITLAAVAGLIAWLLFVYMKRSTRFRWTVFLATLLGGFTVALIVSLVSQPPA